ncbi:MAG: IS1096 element passenger TnpR family protein [Actinomycetota bacterium]
MTDWIAVRVDLVSGAGHKFDPAPGRVFVVGSDHTFLDLYGAIESSFGRWEQVHIHTFEMADGEMIGPPDPDGELKDTDESRVRIVARVQPGDRFTYTYDFGDDWRHECVVEELLAVDVPEPGEERFIDRPFPLSGWGWLPDQYVRRSEDAQQPQWN